MKIAIPALAFGLLRRKFQRARPMKYLRGIALALFSCAALTAAAQPVPDVTGVDAKKPAVKKSEPKKPDTKKAVAKNPEAKKTAAPAKPPVAPKAVAQPAQPPKVYTTGPATLRDKDGNVIPTSPDAYPVDSALPRKK